MGMSKALKTHGWMEQTPENSFPEFLQLTPKARVYLAALRKNLQKKRTPCIGARQSNRIIFK
jgi:hypothetical protein